MNIAVIGKGNVGTGLAAVLSAAGHDAAAFGRDDDLARAVSNAEIVILATPYNAAEDVAGKADFNGTFLPLEPAAP